MISLPSGVTKREIPPRHNGLNMSPYASKRKYRDGALVAMTERDRFRGSLLGLAVGDAIGTAVEFSLVAVSHQYRTGRAHRRRVPLAVAGRDQDHGNRQHADCYSTPDRERSPAERLESCVENGAPFSIAWIRLFAFQFPCHHEPEEG